MSNDTNPLAATIDAMTTEQIREAVTLIGGGHVDTDKRIVRAHLIEAVITREGVEAGDALMDAIGL